MLLKYGSTLASTLGMLLKRNYNELHRHYHTWKHINDMILAAEEMTYAQLIAIAFHDVVYIPGHDGNEEASSQLLWTFWNSHREYFLQATHNDIEIADIIIRDTKDHKPVLNESMLVLDADLHSLGLHEDTYFKNRELIRKEYCAFNDDQFDKGRIQFLYQYLARPKLFHTDKFAQYEEPARHNMQLELRKFYDHL